MTSYHARYPVVYPYSFGCCYRDISRWFARRMLTPQGVAMPDCHTPGEEVAAERTLTRSTRDGRYLPSGSLIASRIADWLPAREWSRSALSNRYPANISHVHVWQRVFALGVITTWMVCDRRKRSAFTARLHVLINVTKLDIVGCNV